MPKSFIIFLLFSTFISASTWMTPVEFDSAFNFQIANSLLKKFSYESSYVPAKIYNEQITTNGPIQYYMALAIGLFGLDLGRSIGLGIIGGLTAVSIYNYSRHSFIFYCLLLLFWPLFTELHNLFLGEILTITMIIIGLTQWETWHNCSESQCQHHKLLPNSIWSNPRLWISSIAFGTAISTKLIAAAVIPLILFCLLNYKISKHQDKTNNYNTIVFTNFIILPILISVVLFTIQFSISIIHSNGSFGDIITSLNLFISEHFHQANKAKVNLEAQSTFMQSNKTIILIVFMSLCLLIYKNISFAIPAFCIIALFFFFHLNIRRMLPFLVPLVLLSIKLATTPSPETNTQHNFRNMFVVLCFGVTLIFGSFITHTPLYLINKLRKFSSAGAPHNIAQIAKDQSTYNQTLLTILNNLAGPVLTTRWWQFPEISLRAGENFYDRRSQENSHLLSERTSYLLFSTENPPDRTSEIDLCGETLFKDGALVLCEYRPPGL